MPYDPQTGIEITDAPKSRRGLLIFFAVVGFIALTFYACVSTFPPRRPNALAPRPQPTFASTVNYSALLCDDAFQTERDYRDNNRFGQYDNLTHIDITLKPGCFGGMVSLPDTNDWRFWRAQLIHNDPKAWVAFWVYGQPNPSLPAPLVEFNQSMTTITRFSQFRLEGQGTLRIYKIGWPR